MNWSHPGVVMTVALLIALGLILRFGKSSTTLTNDFFSGVNNLVGNLTLSKFAGNNP